MFRQKIRKEQKKNSAQKLFKFPTALCSAGKRTRAQADMLMTSMLTKYRYLVNNVCIVASSNLRY